MNFHIVYWQIHQSHLLGGLCRLHATPGSPGRTTRRKKFDPASEHHEI